MYTFLVFTLRDGAAIQVLMEVEKAKDLIGKFYHDELPQFLFGVDLNGMMWSVKSEFLQCLWTRNSEQQPPQSQQQLPPGTAPVWKGYSGRN